MTRKSKRELERVVEQLTDSDTPTTPAAPLADHSEAVVNCIHELARDLERIADRHPDAIVNADDSAATSRYLELVRDEYRLDEDRDAAVQTALKDLVVNNYPRTPPGAFVGFVLAVPAYVYVANEHGESLGTSLTPVAGRRQSARSSRRRMNSSLTLATTPMPAGRYRRRRTSIMEQPV